MAAGAARRLIAVVQAPLLQVILRQERSAELAQVVWKLVLVAPGDLLDQREMAT